MLKIEFCNRKQQLNWQKRPFDICLNQRRLVRRIRAVGGCVMAGGTV